MRGKNINGFSVDSMPFRTGRMMLVAGILLILLGLVIIAWPSATLKIGLLVLGIFCILGGVFAIIAGAAVSTGTLITGILLAIFGIALIAVPYFMADLAAIMFGLLLLFIGIGTMFDMGLPITSFTDNRTVSFIIGAIFLVLGIVIIVFPGQTVNAAMWIFGAILIICGALFAVEGWRYRSFVRISGN